MDIILYYETWPEKFCSDNLGCDGRKICAAEDSNLQGRQIDCRIGTVMTMLRMGGVHPCRLLIFVFVVVLSFSRREAEAFQESLKRQPAKSPAVEPLFLRFSPRPRQTLVYSLQSRMESEGQSFLGRSLTLSAQADGQIEVFVNQVAKESVLTELSSPGIRIFLQTPGRQDQFTLKNPPESPVRMTFDRSGRVRDIRNIESLEEQNPLNFSVVEVLRNYWPAFPDEQVSAGSSWPDHKRIVIPFQGMNLTIELEIVFTLNAIVPSAEGRLALITAAYTAVLSGDRQVEEFRGSFEGRGSGSGSLSFLVDGGYFTDYRLDYVIDGAMVMRQADSKILEWPFRLSAGASLLLLEWR